MAASRRQLEKTRRRLHQKEAEETKENEAAESGAGEGRDGSGDRKEDPSASKGWWGWCSSGVTQVRGWVDPLSVRFV